MVNEEVQRLRGLEIPGTGPHRPAPKPLHRPLTSLLASARRLTNSDLSNLLGKRYSVANSDRQWQDEAWNMYDLVGEQRFLVNTLAGRLSQARLFVGKIDPTNITDDPEEVEDEAIVNILTSLGKSPAAREQLLKRLAVNLYIPGDGYLVGIPNSDTYGPLDQDWYMLSVNEIKLTADQQVSLKLPSSDQEVEYAPDDITLIRVWNPHPRWWGRADSATKSSLPILKELVGLTLHISAQVQSRLAGAGLLIVPQSAQQALRAASGEDVDDDEDVFTDALITAMVTPIEDRGNASAVVPLVVTVPDEAADKFRYLTFSTPLDSETRSLRDEAIRRLSLSQDCPPELLLGTSGMNHWGGWLVKEDVVSTHLEPSLSLICDALTTQYLWPMLVDVLGYTEEEAHGYVVWYDVSHLIVRPNISQDAIVLHDRGVISDSTLRATMGFDDDAMAKIEMDKAQSLALGMVQANPHLLVTPGIEFLVNEMRRIVGGTVDPAMEPARPEALPHTPASVSPTSPAHPDNQGAPATIPQTDDDPPAPATSME